MRNLKKILALVLALVMSFSLMATASAFSDDGDIAADYAEAIDVLSGLEVFKGYDNGATFQPKGSITRAEVAAIIYRIATGDVKDAQTSIYSSWGQFNDVKDGSWYAGYVNYCANAGYIKGYDSKTFGPNDPVTGYQALAMILRAIGYDKNNEFTGSNWQVRTASIAKQRGITDNIVDTLLGQSATREVVAEILFQSILVKTVTFNTNTLSYSENATSLGYDVLKLERLEGVVVANQFADIADDADEGLATGKTRIETADGDRTLNVVTTLDDIGESRYVYGIKTSNNGYNLVTDKMYDTGDNVIADQGAEIKVKDLAKKAKDADGNEMSISVNDSTEYYDNFDRATDKWSSDYLIRYIIADKSLSESDKEFLTSVKAELRDYTFRYTQADGTVVETARIKGWLRTIKIDETFQPEDKVLMEEIFNSADRWYNYVDNTVGTVTPYAMGEVYVGTTSLKDYSDTMSWKGFQDEYINKDLGSFDKTTNGNYLKLVDNNNDGIVEYALRTLYTLDQVASVTTKDDKDTYYYWNLKDNDDVVSPDGGDVKFALNDVVLYAHIDGKYYTEVVNPVKATVKAISFKDEEITTTDDTVYGQSAITNLTDMDDSITAMDEQVEYNLYLDKFGFVRAYKLAQGSQYGLLTEMYPSRVNNGAYVNNGYWIAELMAGEDKAPAEYNVLNSYYNRNQAWNYLQNSNPFIRVDNVNAGNLGNAVPWSGSNGHPGWNTDITAGSIYGYNYLMEATGHLGMVEQTNQFDYDPTFTYTDTKDNGKYDFGEPITSDNLRFTNTNVAKYTKTEDGVNLYSATEYKYENGAQVRYANLDNDNVFEKYTLSEYITAYKKAVNANASNADIEKIFNGLKPVYAVDYIQLAVENIKSGAAHYSIDSTYATNYDHVDREQYNLINYYGSNNYVDAVDDTEFFIVSGRAIQHIVGYKNVPAIDAKNIRSIYAVAENVNTDKDGRDYWVANVIVIEVNKEFNYDSIVMAWANPSQASYQAVAQANGQKAMSVVDSENAKIDTLIPDYQSWNTMWTNYGFYGVFDSAERDATTLTGGIDRLGTRTNAMKPEDDQNWISYNDNGVYAGTVQRESVISGSRAGYIDIYDGNTYKTNVYVGSARIFAVRGDQSYPTLKELGSWRELTNNDNIIYVKNAAGDISFIVDTQYYANDKDSKTFDASWLATEFTRIINEQKHTVDEIVINTVNATDVDGKRYPIPSYYTATDGIEYRLAGLKSYDAKDNTSGNMIRIPVSAFEVPSISVNKADGTSAKLNTLIDLVDVYYGGKKLDRVEIGNVQYYQVPVASADTDGQYVFDAHYALIGVATVDDLAVARVNIVDESNDRPVMSDIIDTTNAPKVDVVDRSAVPNGGAMYLSLANGSDVIRVSFNLTAGYYEPSVSVKVGNTVKNLVVYAGENGYAYSVYFEMTSTERVVLTIGAKSNKNLTYTVALDTNIPEGVTVVKSTDTYNVGNDTEATLVVRTRSDYAIRADVVIGSAVVTCKPETVAGTFTTTWTITFKNVMKDTLVELKAWKINTDNPSTAG